MTCRLMLRRGFYCNLKKLRVKAVTAELSTMSTLRLPLLKLGFSWRS